MYPFLLHAPSKNEIWGGGRIYGMFPLEEYADASELWLVSGSQRGESVIKNGDFKGQTIGEIFEKYGKTAGGIKYNPDKSFPLTVKLIDAKDSLPLGVSTKNRMFYIADADYKSEMILGFSRNIGEAELRQRISTNTLFSVCNLKNVEKGDIITVPAGTLHAVGKGILCYEILCEDEEFYPVSDYGRTDKSGNRMPLKIGSALSAIDYSAKNVKFAGADDTFLYSFGTVTDFPDCEGLSASVIRLSGSVGFKEDESFVSFIILNGDVSMSYPSGTINLKLGDSILVPAKINVKFTGFADILCTRL